MGILFSSLKASKPPAEKRPGAQKMSRGPTTPAAAASGVLAPCDDLEAIWLAHMAAAREVVHDEDDGLALDALRDALPKQAPLVDAWLPRAEREGGCSREAPAPPAERPGDAIGLRQANLTLRARVQHLQKQLDAAHARCRRAEEINAQWRVQHRKVCERAGEQWRSLDEALKKLARQKEVHAHAARLKETLRVRTQQLKASNQRCVELEESVRDLRGMLAQTMRCMHPDEVIGRR